MKNKSLLSKIFFPIIGLGALAWFLIRVIPKPSRATYPCMRIAYPVASGFVVYLLGLSASAFAMGKVREHWKRSRYFTMSAFLIVAIIAGFFAFQSDRPYVYASTLQVDSANSPMGVARGIFPGRVVWSWDPDATNENCGNSSWGDAYYLSKNTNASVVEQMVNESILNLTGESTIADAWNALFTAFNVAKGKGSIGYQSGEKIFIKYNGVGCTVVSSTNHTCSSLANYTMGHTSPQPILILLRHLVNVCGVAQANISVGDPQRDFQNEFWDILHTEFPGVNYICYKGGEGRVKSVPGADTSIRYSDRGVVLREGDWSDMSLGSPIYADKIYTVIEQADYTINVAALKVHERGGMTILGKCNFGSQSREGSKHMHMGLPNPDGVAGGTKNSSFGYGYYRILVDLLGHNKLGGNTMLFVVDGLWGAPGANLPPVKFKILPFNNDWPSSILMSQDPIALESVCFDILKTEFTSDKHAETYPQMAGVDDHLHQAADSLNWPTGIRYDPEKDGTVLGSLGVHEHWNNSTDRQYTRDLHTGDGIELVKLMNTNSVRQIAATGKISKFQLETNYPNPFNPSTNLRYYLPEAAQVELSVFDVQGRLVKTLVRSYQSEGYYEVPWNSQTSGGALASGIYFARLYSTTVRGSDLQVQRMLLVK